MLQPWALLQFSFLLALAIGCFALIIAKLHLIEKAEEQAWEETKEKLASIR